MTEKDICTGEIKISEGALREDLETTPIKAGETADRIFIALGEARDSLMSAAMALPCFTDASNESLLTLAEADELILNLRVRLSHEEPEETAAERNKKANG